CARQADDWECDRLSYKGRLTSARARRVGRRISKSRFHDDLVDEAPGPSLARLHRAHDRMFGRVEMLGRVLVLRRIATANVAAREAHAQMHPRIARLEALFAAAGVRLDVVDLVLVRTSFHRLVPFAAF